MADNQCNNDVKGAIADIEKCLQGKHSLELKVLKNCIKMLSMEHKMETMENVRIKEVALKDKEVALKDKDLQIKDKEIQNQAKEAQITKLENEIESLKIKCKNDDEEISKTQPQLKDNELSSRVKQNVTEEETVSAERISGSPSVDFFKEVSKTFKANLNDLLANGITKFFGHVVQASYKEWFDATFGSLSKDSPVVS